MIPSKVTPAKIVSAVLVVALAAVLLLGGGAALANRLPQTPVQDTNSPDGGDAPIVDAGQPTVDSPDDLAADPAAPQAITRYTHISGSVFQTLYGTTQFAYGGSGCVYASGGGNPYLNHPVELPYDSTVTQLRLYYKDTNASANAHLWLARYDDGLSFTYIVTATTAGSAGWGTATVSLNRQLDYDNYSYTMVWSQPVADSTLQLCGYRIGYTSPVTFGMALPTLSKP